MLEYKIVSAGDTDALENAVADLIDLGFTPCGGLAVSESSNRMVWAQAMIRDGEPTTLQPVDAEPLIDLEKE